ncbi:MAG TPA: hypothetical protein VI814_09700 [Candidatus Limnocylindria bacterium]
MAVLRGLPATLAVVLLLTGCSIGSAPAGSASAPSVAVASALPTYPPIPEDPQVRVPRTNAAMVDADPSATPEPAITPTAQPRATPAARAATPTCPSDWFCYPRLSIAGPIVPYSDCTGQTDIGTSIRAFTCLSPFYLMGHAYTQMGRITAWRAGDVVFAYGRAFAVYGAITAQSCVRSSGPLAPLSIQTSLSPSTCGSVLVVQAR